MLLAPRNDILTRERLTAVQFSWGELHQMPISTDFRFAADGTIAGYSHQNERFWSLQDGLLRIFNQDRALTWAFDIMFADTGRLILISKYQNDPHWQPFFCLIEQPPYARAAAPQAVRLVIWDLDDTFWHGTLSEGAVTPIASNIALIHTLNERGIVNAICSKNDFELTRQTLEGLGLWDDFIFPEIAFIPKGPAIARIIEAVQLRAETILFIDDNETNLHEARFYNPGLQIAGPDMIPNLLDDPRLKGKPDPGRTRLGHYKVLEQKQSERLAAAGDNEKFLRDSDIRVSFHADSAAQFPRIHDLVNRTNQLNFTKNRWPEDESSACAAFEAELAAFGAYHGYVKVADRYGQYGICGFYLVVDGVAKHFLFSCRAMNMGIEQFVYERLGCPRFQVPNGMISALGAQAGWVRLVADADTEILEDSVKLPTICIRGACDMSMTSNYLRTRINIIEELTFAWDGWEICSTPRIIALHDELKSPANQAIIAQLPGMPENRFESDIISGESDGYILSFSQESFHGLYRARSTGMILPMGHFSIGHMQQTKFDYTSLPYDEIEAAGIIGISPKQWSFFLKEFEFIGGFNEPLFICDIDHLFARLTTHKKPVIIIGLNEKIGTDDYILKFFANINSIVRPRALDAGFAYIDVNDFITRLDDLAPDNVKGGAHFARHIYARLAEISLDLFKPRLTQGPTMSWSAPLEGSASPDIHALS